MSRTIDIFDGSADQSTLRNSSTSIRKLRRQFETQFQEKQEERTRPPRITTTREILIGNKIVKSQIEGKEQELKKSKREESIVVATIDVSAKDIPKEPQAPAKLLRFFTGCSSEGSNEKSLPPVVNEDKRISSKGKVELETRVQSTEPICDFESIYEGIMKEPNQLASRSMELAFEEIFAQLSYGDLSRVDEIFERLYQSGIRDALGMIFISAPPPGLCS